MCLYMFVQRSQCPQFSRVAKVTGLLASDTDNPRFCIVSDLNRSTGAFVIKYGKIDSTVEITVNAAPDGIHANAKTICNRFVCFGLRLP